MRPAARLPGAGAPGGRLPRVAPGRPGRPEHRPARRPLVALREGTFGSEFAGLADCPACGEKTELTFRAADLMPAPLAADPPAELALRVDGRELRFRLPTSADLMEIDGLEPLAGRERLLARCLPAGRDHLPGEVIDAVLAKMAEADPLADIQLALTCPACGRTWQAGFDIVAFFWSEIQARVRGLLREVHSLASFYGWSEAEILALSPARRRLYLEMVGE